MIKRLLPVLVLCAAVAAVTPTRADAGRECDGLIVCIPVAGPWVQVFGSAEADLLPARVSRPGPGDRRSRRRPRRAARDHVPRQPRRTCGAGRDHEPSRCLRCRDDPRPVRLPAAARLHPHERGRRPQPHGLRQPTRQLQAVAPPVDATIRRVKNVRLKDRQSERLVHACLDGERVLSFSTAVAFRTSRPPSLSTLGSVRATPRLTGRRVVVEVRSGITRPANVRVEVQIHAVCAKGPS